MMSQCVAADIVLPHHHQAVLHFGLLRAQYSGPSAVCRRPERVPASADVLGLSCGKALLRSVMLIDRRLLTLSQGPAACHAQEKLVKWTPGGLCFCHRLKSYTFQLLFY